MSAGGHYLINFYEDINVATKGHQEHLNTYFHLNSVAFCSFIYGFPVGTDVTHTLLLDIPVFMYDTNNKFEHAMVAVT